MENNHSMNQANATCTNSNSTLIILKRVSLTDTEIASVAGQLETLQVNNPSVESDQPATSLEKLDCLATTSVGVVSLPHAISSSKSSLSDKSSHVVSSTSIYSENTVCIASRKRSKSDIITDSFTCSKKQRECMIDALPAHLQLGAHENTFPMALTNDDSTINAYGLDYNTEESILIEQLNMNDECNVPSYIS
jgi:hypothetical protein